MSCKNTAWAQCRFPFVTSSFIHSVQRLWLFVFCFFVAHQKESKRRHRHNATKGMAAERFSKSKSKSILCEAFCSFNSGFCVWVVLVCCGEVWHVRCCVAGGADTLGRGLLFSWRGWHRFLRVLLGVIHQFVFYNLLFTFLYLPLGNNFLARTALFGCLFQ